MSDRYGPLIEQLCPEHVPPGYRLRKQPYRCPECRTQRIVMNTEEEK